MIGLYKDQTEYMLVMQKKEVEFKREQVFSQLLSVRERKKRLVEDIFLYLCFLLVPLLVLAFSFLMLMAGGLALRIVFVFLLVVSSAAAIFLGPASLYKVISCMLMYLFNQRGGNMMIFGKLYSVYTYKTEESYCMGKLTKLDGYLEQIDAWLNGEDVPTAEYLQEVFDNMDLSFTIRIATLKDPVVNHLRSYLFPLFVLTIFLLCMLIWWFDLHALNMVYNALGNL